MNIYGKCIDIVKLSIYSMSDGLAEIIATHLRDGWKKI